eukprot:TRINITY_DN7008_c0_g2_i1.p1 TRINITY_DN7008_c0_g2~~TRINITY_DN7008_c0_g2_i1.p1  ORF type:complete len:890 (+),score=227.80 TRINITY_DN7008_c0_g2_i1:365-2671(+)
MSKTDQQEDARTTPGKTEANQEERTAEQATIVSKKEKKEKKDKDKKDKDKKEKKAKEDKSTNAQVEMREGMVAERKPTKDKKDKKEKNDKHANKDKDEKDKKAVEGRTGKHEAAAPQDGAAEQARTMDSKEKKTKKHKDKKDKKTKREHDEDENQVERETADEGEFIQESADKEQAAIGTGKRISGTGNTGGATAEREVSSSSFETTLAVGSNALRAVAEEACAAESSSQSNSAAAELSVIPVPVLDDEDTWGSWSSSGKVATQIKNEQAWSGWEHHSWSKHSGGSRSSSHNIQQNHGGTAQTDNGQGNWSRNRSWEQTSCWDQGGWQACKKEQGWDPNNHQSSWDSWSWHSRNSWRGNKDCNLSNSSSSEDGGGWSWHEAWNSSSSLEEGRGRSWDEAWKTSSSGEGGDGRSWNETRSSASRDAVDGTRDERHQHLALAVPAVCDTAQPVTPVYDLHEWVHFNLEQWQSNQHFFNHLPTLPPGWIRKFSRSALPEFKIYFQNVNTMETALDFQYVQASSAASSLAIADAPMEQQQCGHYFGGQFHGPDVAAAPPAIFDQPFDPLGYIRQQEGLARHQQMQQQQFLQNFAAREVFAAKAVNQAAAVVEEDRLKRQAAEAAADEERRKRQAAEAAMQAAIEAVADEERRKRQTAEAAIQSAKEAAAENEKLAAQAQSEAAILDERQQRQAAAAKSEAEAAIFAEMAALAKTLAAEQARADSEAAQRHAEERMAKDINAEPPTKRFKLPLKCPAFAQGICSKGDACQYRH